MIRFIDLTEEYWTHPEVSSPICAFLNTSDDRFLQTEDGQHTFDCLEEVKEHPRAKRMLALLPNNFFTE